MFGKILLAIDGSEHSMKAADYAINLAKTDNAEVEIIHVRDSVEGYPSRVVYDAAALEKALAEDAEEVMVRAAAKFQETGVKHTKKIITGDAADVICREAEEKGIKIIVMGSRGLNTVTRFVLGSVSSKVLTYAHCPVLIVR